MATVRKVRQWWVADYRDRQGVRHRERATSVTGKNTRKAAQDLLTRRLNEIGANTYQAPTEAVTFDELSERFETEYIAVEVKPNTAKDYRANLRLYVGPFFEGAKLNEIGVGTVEAFRARLVADGVGARTVNKSLVLLGSMFRYAQRLGWMTGNPASLTKKLRIEGDHRDDVDAAILSPAEVDRVLAKAGRWRLVIATAVFTGLREGEVLGLRWQDVDFDARRVRVRQQAQRDGLRELKTRHARRDVPLPDVLVRELREWKLLCPKGDHDLVFPNSSGNPENPSNLLARGFYPALRAAKVKRIRFHDLRHCYVSALIAQGVNIKIIQRLVGHADVGTTLNRYGHLLPDSTDGIADKLSATMAPKWAGCPESAQQLGTGTEDERAKVVEFR